jgi:hypothetical protein
VADTPFSVDMLLRRHAGDPEALQRLARVLGAQVTDTVGLITRTVAEGRLVETELAAHTIRIALTDLGGKGGCRRRRSGSSRPPAPGHASRWRQRCCPT